jgi:hypothetical protein
MKWPQGSGPRSVMRSIVGGVIVLALGDGRAAGTAWPGAPRHARASTGSTAHTGRGAAAWSAVHSGGTGGGAGPRAAERLGLWSDHVAE